MIRQILQGYIVNRMLMRPASAPRGNPIGRFVFTLVFLFFLVALGYAWLAGGWR